MFSPLLRSTPISSPDRKEDEDDDTSSVLSITPSDVEAFDLLKQDFNRRSYCSSIQSNDSHEVSQYHTPRISISTANMSGDIPPQDNVHSRRTHRPPIVVANGYMSAANPSQFPGYSSGGIQNHFHGSAMSMTLNLNTPGNYSVDLRADMRFPNNGTNVAPNASPQRFNNGHNAQQ